MKIYSFNGSNNVCGAMIKEVRKNSSFLKKISLQNYK